MRRLPLIAACLLAAWLAAETRAEPPASIRMPTYDSLPGFPSSEAGIRRWSTVAHPSACSRPGGHGSYPWPVRPFRRRHPVRGNFGDPRTIFNPIVGLYSFHNGVDIVAEPGTKVYPVVSGVARLAGAQEVVVRTRDGHSFQYSHVAPAVRNGQRVDALKTVLGTVVPRAAHVHLTEIANGIVQNPLAPGHLTPYGDRRPPSVRGLSFRDGAGRELDPEALRSAIAVVAWADDETSLPVPGRWHGLPVAPARLTWRLTAPSGAVAAEGTGFDFRTTIPDNDSFWLVYASGTFQNAPAVGRERRLGVPGRYLYALGPAPLDTDALPSGRYLLTVTAEDVCGNRGSLSKPVRIAPHPEPPPALVPARRPSVRRAAPRAPRSWPRGRSGYTVVLASVPRSEGKEAALLRAREARARGLPRVGVLVSERFSSLQPGYRVVFSGVYATAGEAASAAFHASSRYPGAYPRLVVGEHRRARRRDALVLASVPVGAGRRAALREAERAHRAGIGRVRVLRSDRLRGFRPGYFVITGDREAAEAVSTIYPTAYVRTLVARRASPGAPDK